MKLDDRNSDQYFVSRTDDTSQVLAVTFNSVRHEIAFEKDNGPEPVHRLIAIDVRDSKPFVSHRKFGSDLGVLLAVGIADVVRKAIDALVAT